MEKPLTPLLPPRMKLPLLAARTQPNHLVTLLKRPINNLPSLKMVLAMLPVKPLRKKMRALLIPQFLLPLETPTTRLLPREQSSISVQPLIKAPLMLVAINGTLRNGPTSNLKMVSGTNGVTSPTSGLMLSSQLENITKLVL